MKNITKQYEEALDFCDDAFNDTKYVKFYTNTIGTVGIKKKAIAKVINDNDIRLINVMESKIHSLDEYCDWEYWYDVSTTIISRLNLKYHKCALSIGVIDYIREIASKVKYEDAPLEILFKSSSRLVDLVLTDSLANYKENIDYTLYIARGDDSPHGISILSKKLHDNNKLISILQEL